MNFRALGILVLLFTTEALAQQWGPEIRVTNHPGNSYRPDIACDSKDNVYVVWEDDRDGNFEIRYAKYDNNGKALITDTRLTNTLPSSRFPKLVVDSKNRVYIVWREDTDRMLNANYGLFCAILNENCQPMLPKFIEVEGTGSALGSLTPNITIDEFDNLHIVWDQNYTYRTPTDTIYNANEVCYTKIQPIGQVQIAKSILTEKGFHAREPAITVDYNSYLHVTWARLALSNLDPRVAYWILQYTKFDSVGQPVVGPVAITSNTGNSRYQNMIADRGGIHCVYSGLRNRKLDIFYQKLDYDGRIIVAETNISRSSQDTGRPQFVRQRNGTFHLVWDEDNFGTENEIYYARIDSNGGLQQPRTRIDKGSRDVHDPAIGVNNSGRIFVVWYDNRYGNWDILLTHTQTISTNVQDFSSSTIQPHDLGNPITVYPSPVHGHAVFRYRIDENSMISVSIYDSCGRLVQAFPVHEQFPGEHNFLWKTSNDKGQPVPSGMYICRIAVNGVKAKYTAVTKILVLR
jgi:hypothetical protein